MPADDRRFGQLSTADHERTKCWFQLSSFAILLFHSREKLDAIYPDDQLMREQT